MTSTYSGRISLSLRIDSTLSDRFPGLTTKIVNLKGVEVREESNELETFKAEVLERVRSNWTLEQLREHSTFRAYRDFFWRMGVDPTKNRPAAEALIRRILHGNPIPMINTLVDSYNLASIESTVAIAAFDEDKLKGDLHIRQAERGEEFMGIGMGKPALLIGGEVVVNDDDRLVAVYPYRDADFSKVTAQTKNVVFLICGVPNIAAETLKDAGKVTVEYVTRFCDGTSGDR